VGAVGEAGPVEEVAAAVLLRLREEERAVARLLRHRLGQEAVGEVPPDAGAELGLVDLAPLDDLLDAGEDVLDVERLRDVVVDAVGEALGAGGVVGLGREEDEGDGGGALVAAQRGQQREPVHPRHHDVRDDEVGDLLLDEGEGLLPVLGRAHDVALPDPVLEEAPERRVVLDDEDGVRGGVGRGGHGGGGGEGVHRAGVAVAEGSADPSAAVAAAGSPVASGGEGRTGWGVTGGSAARPRGVWRGVWRGASRGGGPGGGWGGAWGAGKRGRRLSGTAAGRTTKARRWRPSAVGS